MATALYSPSPKSASTRDAFWVLRMAAALLAIAAWLVIMLQLALLVRAEMVLGQIVRDANDFAELPAVRATELREFVTRRTERAGWKHARVLIVPSGAGVYHVARIEIPAVDAMPCFLRPLSSFSRTVTRPVSASWLSSQTARGGPAIETAPTAVERSFAERKRTLTTAG